MSTTLYGKFCTVLPRIGITSKGLGFACPTRNSKIYVVFQQTQFEGKEYSGCGRPGLSWQKACQSRHSSRLDQSGAEYLVMREVAIAGVICWTVCFFDVETLLCLMEVQGLLCRPHCDFTDSLWPNSFLFRIHGALECAFLLKFLKSRTSSVFVFSDYAAVTK